MTTALLSVLAAQNAVGQELLWTRDGDPAHNYRFGWQAKGTSDIDGDGVGDVLLGDPWWRDGAGYRLGEVHLVSGVDGSVLWRATGEFDSLFGTGLTTVEDVDGDGFRDLFLGAPNASGVGRAYIYSYSTGQILSTFAGDRSSSLGAVLLELDDIDQNGRKDYLVTAHGWASFAPYRLTGRFFVYSGEDHAILDEVRGEREFSLFSFPTTVISDLDGDGFRDVVLAAGEWGDQAEGKIYAYSMKPPATLLWSVEGTFHQVLGQMVENVGDQDGDGLDDVAVTCREGGDWYTPWTVTLYSGKTGAVIHRIFEFETDTSFGNNGLVGTGDVDGDGYCDFLIGDSLKDDPLRDMGNAHLFQGRTFRHLYTLVGEGMDGLFGYRCAAPGDVNHDGLADFLISAPYQDVLDDTDDSGRVYCFAGNDLFLLPSRRTAAAGDSVTLSVRAGDAGQLYLLAVVAVDDQPHFQLLSVGLLDPNGEANFTATVPPGLSGTKLHLKAFARKLPTRKGPRIGDSIAEPVLLE